MICPNCGKENSDNAYYCNDCGCALKENAPAAGPGLKKGPAVQEKAEQKAYAFRSKWLVFFLCLFFGWLGIHRFYVGKIGTGILYALTGGCLGLGWFMDLFSILCGAFRDKNGYPVM